MEGFVRNKIFYVTLFAWLSVITQIVLSDSFFGTSYIHLPLPDDFSTTEVGLRFRTSRTKGLLLYAFNNDNAFIIRLRDSKIQAVCVSGDNEILLQSKRRPRLNNLRWHEVRVTLSNGQGILYIDGIEKDQQTVQQASLSLQSVYVGGTNNLESKHLSGADKYFRGCLEDVTVGNINVLAASKTTDGAMYHDITQECSVEFEAGMDEPISFVKETAFVLFPKWHIQDEGSFACWIRTSAPRGLLMFSYQGNNFIAAEIEDGHIRVLVKTPSNSDTVAVMSQRTVNDRIWHFIIIDLSQGHITISVDYNPEEFALSSPFQDPFEFLGSVYVGGVIHRARTLAFGSDLMSVTHASTGGSLRGCVRDIELNGVQFAIGDSHVTHGIQVGCLYEFPCASSPCEDNTVCVETGPVDHVCECTGDGCAPTSPTTIESTTVQISTTTEISTTVSTQEPTTPVLSLFTIQPLPVREGGGIRIASTNIRLNIDLRQYGMRQSQVIFRMSEPPAFGHIEKDVLRRGDSRVQFTFLDLLAGKISYVHDGTENFEDSVVFLVSFSRRGPPLSDLPELVNLTLPITITPVNDPPDIVVADDDTFRMIKNTKRTLVSDFVHAFDPDTPSSDVLITIVSQQGNVGYFEHEESEGVSITEFTQEEIDHGKVAYVHTGPSWKSRIVLKAADGEEKSALASFRIEAAELMLSVTNLTVIRTNPSSGQLIKLSNLKVVTNDPDDSFEVSYQITTPPRLGNIQTLDQNGAWTKATRFTHADIESNRVRYFATRAIGESEVTYDQVGISARSGAVSKPGIFLPVEIVVTSVEVIINTGLVLDVASEGFITAGNLSSEAFHVLDGSPITYKIVRSPTNGFISKHPSGMLHEGQNFTQQDIEAGLVTYQLNRKFYESFNDTLFFRVTVSSVQTAVLQFVITYYPDSQHVDVTNNGIAVQEGETYVLTPADLHLQTGASSDFSYTVIYAPKHGKLQLIDPSSKAIVEQNATSFLSLDITRGALQYSHDDSETLNDSFTINATSTFLDRFGRNKQASYTGKVNISIELQNDNSPVRVINKIFNVIKNGRTVLTGDDILYSDADIDFDDDNLLYQRQRIEAGDLVRSDDYSESVFKFRQKELLAGEVTFKHQGSRERSRMLFLVLDENRKHYVAGFLEIQALESYVNTSANTGLEVGRGLASVITSFNLSADTNINVKPRNVDFTITSGPVHGALLAEGVSIQQFTQESLNNGDVTYQHNNMSDNLSDNFNFTVGTKGLEYQGQFKIRVLIASKDLPPSVEKMQPVVVEAGKEIILNKFNLKISHPNNLASEIVYKVTSPPKYGELRLRNEFGIIVSRSPPLPEEILRNRRDTEDSAMHFSQQDVNRGFISYIQTDNSELLDEFSLEVSNGYTTLTNLTMTIDIAPTIVPLAVQNFTVLEGRSKTITADIIRVAHALYEPRLFTVHILESPQHGIIENTRQSGTNLRSFSTQDIANEFIYYVHDGSEGTLDHFKIALNDSDDKYSEAYTLFVTVQQENDQPPRVTLNEGLVAILGARTPFTDASLSASDPDTPDSNLTFTITNPRVGFVAHKSSVQDAVTSFTQDDLTSGSLVFVHQGSRTGGFRFQVSDGVHVTQQQIFSIRASPLLLRLVNNSQLEVQPGSLQPITREHLYVGTNEEPVSELSKPITFVVTQEPESGEIVKFEGGADGMGYEQTLSFTQEDIDQNRIAFKHDNSSTLRTDSFRFDVFLPLSQNLSQLVFELSIPIEEMQETTEPVPTTTVAPATTSASEEDPLGIINTGVELSEGEEITITEDNLNANSLLLGSSGYVTYTVDKVPRHGFLSLGGRNITLGNSFTHPELTLEGLKYSHDHSDTLEDSFNFTATVKLLGAAAAATEGAVLPWGKRVFPITILPVNDQVFIMVTASLRMSVVQGERTVFGPSVLNISDPDNPPEDINIRMLNQPSNGRLVLAEDPSTSVRTFTQAEVNQNKLRFIHDGGSISGAFLFRVDDGKHFQIKQFFIDVVPRVLVLQSVSPLVLSQGDTDGVLTGLNLNVSSNANSSMLYYNVTMSGRFGEIRVDSSPAFTFTQFDVEHGIVTYFQTNMSSSQDNMQFSLYDDFNVIPNVTLQVTVEPLIGINNIAVSSGDTIAFERFNLNATALAKKTNNTPSFRIKDAPVLGSIVNVTSGDMVLNFDVADIDKGEIGYSADILDIEENATVADNFTLMLLAKNAQPVEISLSALLGPQIIQSTTPLTTTKMALPPTEAIMDVVDLSIPFQEEDLTTEIMTPDDGPSRKAMDNGKSSSIIFIIIGVVIALIFLIIILVVIIWRKRKRRKTVMKLPSQEDFTERVTVAEPAAEALSDAPPDSQIPSPADEGYDTSTVTQPMIRRPVQSPMVPQVKVTPLGRPPSPVNSYASLTSNGTFQSSAPSNWTSCDPEMFSHMRSRSPTLKKSQYWV